MKVRIVKCSKSPYEWYIDKIGDILTVKDVAIHFYAYEGVLNILKEDCEILEADEPKPEPFDLERALKGEKFYLIGSEFDDYRLIGKSESPLQTYIVEKSSGNAYQLGYYKLGELEDFKMATRETDYQTVWVNLYDEPFNDKCLRNSYAFHKKDDAIEVQGRLKDDRYIGTFPITFKKP